MCDPTTLVVGTMIASGGVQAFSQYQQGVSQQKAYENQAAMYRYQAQLNQQQADLAIKTGDANSKVTQDIASQESKKLSSTIAESMGATKTAMAKNAIGGKTAEDIVGSSFDKARMDELALRYNADVKSYEYKEQAKNAAWGYNIEANQNLLAANNSIAAGKRAKSAGAMNAFATLLSTAASSAFAGAQLWAPGVGSASTGATPYTNAIINLH